MNIENSNKIVSNSTSRLFSIIPFPNFGLNEVEIINNKQFSKREVDVIACIISGRTAKKIAALLSIAPRTVESHIYNIMLKLGCNSRNNLIDFIEQTGKYSLIKQHYTNLLIRLAFEESLKKTAFVLKDKPEHITLLVENKKEKEILNFIQRITVDLTCIGYTLAVMDNKNIEALTNQELEENYIVEEILPKNQPNYYFLFFELLKRVNPLFFEELDKILLDFKQHFQDLKINESVISESEYKTHHSSIEETPKAIVNQSERNYLYRYFKNRKRLFVTAGVGCALFLCLIITFTSMKWYGIELGIGKNKPIISDLLLPYESTLLKRRDLIKEIHNKFNNTESIQTVVLVGTGGAGKTTLARNYARQQKEKVIWEINAETKESLFSSFTNLAYALSKTEDDRKILNELKEIKSGDDREKQLLHFIKNKLNTVSKWFLIYDNVEAFNNILDYFPNNPEAWGNGRVIMTTRDANIKNNSHINPDNIINIKELTETEKVTLFTGILWGNHSKKVDSEHTKQINTLLKELSPLPLDISTAAYYIKDTKISYQEYLECIRTSNIDFLKTQENLLRDNSDYTKTRYGIIKLTLKKIIEEHPDFKALLLFISLVDSQNIPKDLLISYKKQNVVDQFMHCLRRHSLMTSEENASTFSLHRSTQEIMLAYLVEQLKFEKNNILIQSVADSLQNYIRDAFAEEEFLRTKGLAIHLEKLLSRKVLSTLSIGSIESKLGGIYYYLLGDAIKAQQYLEKGLNNLNRSNSLEISSQYVKEEDKLKIAWASEYLGRVYNELDDYEKAKNLLEHSIQIHRTISKNNNEIARCLGHLSVVYRNLGDYEKVKLFLEQSLDLYQNTLNKNYKGIAWVMGRLGIAFRDLGDYEKSRYFLEQSLVIYKKHCAENHNRIGWTLAWLGRVYKESGYFEKAVQFLEQGLIIHRKHFSENNVNIAWILTQLGNAYHMLGAYEKAKQALEESLAIYQKYPGNHILVAGALEDLGNLFNDLGYHQKGKEILLKCMSIMNEYSKNPIWKAGVITSLGVVHRDLGEYKMAKEFLEQSIQIHKNNASRNPIWGSCSLGYLGVVHRDLGEFETAKSLLEQNLAVYEKHYGKDHIKTARILRDIGQLYLLQGKFEIAENTLNKTFKIFQKNMHPDRYQDLELLGDLYLKKSAHAIADPNNEKAVQNFKKQAKEFLKQALEIAKINFSADSFHIKRIESKL